MCGTMRTWQKTSTRINPHSSANTLVTIQHKVSRSIFLVLLSLSSTSDVFIVTDSSLYLFRVTVAVAGGNYMLASQWNVVCGTIFSSQQRTKLPISNHQMHQRETMRLGRISMLFSCRSFFLIRPKDGEVSVVNCSFVGLTRLGRAEAMRLRAALRKGCRTHLLNWVQRTL